MRFLKLFMSSCFSFITGGFLNMLVLAVNHGKMPVLLDKYRLFPIELDDVHVAMTANSHFKILCDIIPVSHCVMSMGDVLLIFGFLGMIVSFLGMYYIFIKKILVN